MRNLNVVALAGLLTLGAVATLPLDAAKAQPTATSEDTTAAEHAQTFAMLRWQHDFESKIDLLVLKAGDSPSVKRFAGKAIGDSSQADETLAALAHDLTVDIGAYTPATQGERDKLLALETTAVSLESLSGKALDEAYLKLQDIFLKDAIAGVDAAAADETNERVKALLDDVKTKATSRLEAATTLTNRAGDGSLDTGNGGGTGGNGNGNGNGDGHGNGNGNGNGTTTGDNGNGNGNGNGTGNGNGNGNGGSSCTNVCSCTCNASHEQSPLFH